MACSVVRGKGVEQAGIVSHFWRYYSKYMSLSPVFVAEAGFEPAASGLWARRATSALLRNVVIGGGLQPP